MRERGTGGRKANNLNWPRKNVWCKMYSKVRFGEVGCKCFQSMGPTVSQIRYQAFFFFLDTVMKACPKSYVFRLNFSWLWKFHTTYSKLKHSPEMLLKDTCFFPPKKGIKFDFIISLNVNILASLSLCIPGRSCVQQVGGKAFEFFWPSGQWQNTGLAYVSQESLTIKHPFLDYC